ncbi:MAG: hypothetical protein J6Z11_17150, partial [Candidatus Riflebacteria bacterium]|nr:hypothetical protein [Candidatus Riflebacteria bacterium]
MKSKINKSGFTLVEVAIAVGMAAALLAFAMKMTSSVRGDVAKGTVNLQNLQNARKVINYLRRDFICAIPTYDHNESMEITDEVRAEPMVYVAGAYDNAHNTKPIMVSKHDVFFSKKEFDSSRNVVIKAVQYTFDPTNHTLIRGTNNGSNKVFK